MSGVEGLLVLPCLALRLELLLVLGPSPAPAVADAADPAALGCCCVPLMVLVLMLLVHMAVCRREEAEGVRGEWLRPSQGMIAAAMKLGLVIRL